jgi:integrase
MPSLIEFKQPRRDRVSSLPVCNKPDRPSAPSVINLPQLAVPTDNNELKGGGGIIAPSPTVVSSSPSQPANDIVSAATPIRRRGKCMSRRKGQNGNVFVKSNCKLGRCEHQKGLCPKYGRYWKDQPGLHERLRVVVSLGNVTQTVAERNLRDHILKTQVDSPETFVEVISPSITFKEQARWWLDEMRAGRIVSRKKRLPIKPATLAGYQAAVNWLNETIGNTALADIKNEVAKQLVIKMKAANLADKTVVNYFQVVKAVVASAVSSEGEQLYPRNWNFHFIGLPVIDEKKQCKPSLTATEVKQVLARAKGRYKVLFALLPGTGLRIGEALGLKLGEHLSGDFSTIRVQQSVWRGSVQTPKTDNAVREIDIPTPLATFLKASVGGRTSGFLFQSDSGRPLTQRNVLRDGLGKIRRDLQLEHGTGFHSFRRFRTAHLRKNRVPWDLQKLWLGHANRDVTDRYAEQLKEDVEWRKQEAERAGLGFKLPTLESSVGLLGLPKQQKSKLKKVA